MAAFLFLVPVKRNLARFPVDGSMVITSAANTATTTMMITTIITTIAVINLEN